MTTTKTAVTELREWRDEHEATVSYSAAGDGQVQVTVHAHGDAVSATGPDAASAAASVLPILAAL